MGGASDEPDKHGYDANKLGLSFVSTIDAFLCCQNVETCGALQGRSPRNIEKPTTIRIGKLSVSFRNVDYDYEDEDDYELMGVPMQKSGRNHRDLKKSESLPFRPPIDLISHLPLFSGKWMNHLTDAGFVGHTSLFARQSSQAEGLITHQ